MSLALATYDAPNLTKRIGEPMRSKTAGAATKPLTLTKSQRRDARSMLATMLTYKRPYGSETDDLFVATYLDILPGCMVDGFGNRRVSIPYPDGRLPNVLWSAHTDTVHYDDGFQAIQDHGPGWLLCLPEDSPSNCLGGDNTVGCWLLIHMIRAQIPGLYVFHRGEEVGCKGSRWIAENDHHSLEGIDAAIAFDRRGSKSIITHQMGGRTCSDRFARELEGQFGLGLAGDDTGLYTDTASYSDMVPECTNVSAGFSDEHSRREIVDTPYSMRLLAALLALDPAKIVAYRDPSAAGRYSSYSSASTRSRKGKAATYAGGWGYDPFDDNRYCDPNAPYPGECSDDLGGLIDDKRELVKLVAANPAAIADFLEECGVSVEDVEAFLFNTVGAY